MTPMKLGSTFKTPPMSVEPDFGDALVALSEYAAQSPSGAKSSTWQVLVEDFKARGDVRKMDVFADGAFRGYGFVREDHAGIGYKASHARRTVEARTARLLRKVSNRLWGWSIGVDHHLNTAYAGDGLRSLAHRGDLAGYLAYCRQHGFSPLSGNGAKSYYCATLAVENLPRDNASHVLEIGAGVGMLPAVVMSKAQVESYWIVDLPEMLGVSALTLRSLFPKVPMAFHFPGAPVPPREAIIHLVVPDSVADIPSRSIDLGVNIDSFQEMTEAQVTDYLGLFQRTLRDGGRIVTLNRRKHLVPEGFDNNPLLYPYAKENRVLRWEVDPFMADVFNFTGFRRDGWLLRIEEVRRAPERP